MRLRRDRVWLRVTEVWWKNMAECDKVQVCLGVGEYSIVSPHSQVPCLVAVYGRVCTCHLEVLGIHRESVVTDTVQSRRKNLKVSHT